MSTRPLLIAGAALTFLMPALPATAADLYNPPPETDYEPAEAVRAPAPWYVALRGGVVYTDDTSFETLGTTVDTTYDAGPFVAGAIGYQFQNWGLRAEAELGYLESSVSSHDVAGVGSFQDDDAFGDTSAMFGLASLYYDLPINSPLRPFFGGGIGVADVSFEGHGTTPTGTVLDDSSQAFAWHLTAGVNYDIAPNMALEVGYRYLEFDGVDLTAADGTETSIDAGNHIGFAGLKYRF